MKPYTLDEAEAALRHAITAGDTTRITALETIVDRLDTHPPAPSLHSAALWYATNGFKVFPLQPGTKIPFKGSRGCKDASTNTDVIDGWWEDTPDANIGLATGHHVDVVDIDGHTGQTTRTANWPMFNALHVLARVTTPRPGGMHLYVPATDLGNKAGLLPGIDYRSVGGYVVAPPSRTQVGSYRFLAPIDLDALAAAA